MRNGGNTFDGSGTESDSSANIAASSDHGLTTVRKRGPKTYFDEDAQEYKGDNLYFISDGEWIKIGRGASATARLMSCQTGNPRRLTLIAEIADKGWQEDFWHCCWDRHRGLGEWFASTQPLLNAIAAAVAGEDWTDHVPPLCRFECDLGEWQEHMLDAIDAYEEEVLDARPSITARTAAFRAIHDPDFDGRSVLTRHADALNKLLILKPELFA